MDRKLEDDTSARTPGSALESEDTHSGELWNQYNRRRSRNSVVTKIGTVLMWLIVLAVVTIGLWIVAFR